MNLEQALAEGYYFAAVNELLKGASPIGACCLGMSAIAWQLTGKLPPRKFLELLVQCKSLAEGDTVYQQLMSYLGGPSLVRFPACI